MSFFGGTELRQLVFIATAWRDWPFDDESWRSCDRLVRGLLGRGTSNADNAGKAWIAVTGDGAVQPADLVSGTAAQEKVETFIGRLKAATRPGNVPERTELITGWRLRVLCDPERTRAVLPDAETSPNDDGNAVPWAALDVHFSGNAKTGFQIHFGFSFWAMRPPWYPRDVQHATSRIGLDDVAALRDTFRRRASTAARNLVDEHFGAETTLVWEREYAPPVFWVATLASTRGKLPRYLSQPDVAQRLVRPLLDRGPTDSGVAASIIDGNVLALRHFRHERAAASGDESESAEGRRAIRPVYFLLFDPESGPAGKPKDYGFQQVVTLLAEFEARAATDMHDIDDDLEVWRTHVGVYNSVAEQAGTLWDAVALHLPVRKGTDLANTHRAIALIHQTLLQGVADLAEVVSQVDALINKVDELSDELADLVDGGLAEQPLSSAQSTVGKAVAQASQLSRLRQLSESAAADAQRVKGQHEGLLASIAHAFDERRVRELDVLQRGSFFLSVVVGAVTIVAVLDFLFNIKSTSPLRGAWWLLPGLPAAVLGLGVLIAVIAALQSVRKARDISSSAFRGDYEKVLAYLRDSSTRELDRRPSGMKQLGEPTRGDWEERDSALATRFAKLWDDATAGEPRAGSRCRPPATDIKLLAEEIEQWTLRALLLSERPRRFSRYRLPKLTLLYRYCANLEQARKWDIGTAVVADSDLKRTLSQEGYRTVEARAIDQRIMAKAAESPTTARLLAHIEQALGSRTPATELHRVNRQFVKHAVQRLTDQRVRQFIDVGTGIPGTDSVQTLAGPDARVVYVDNAPSTVAQARALLTETDRTQVIHEDMQKPADIWRKATAGGLIDPHEPVAVIFTRVLGYLEDDEALTVVNGFRECLPAGSYIVISHVASGGLGGDGLSRVPSNNNGLSPERIRNREQIQRFFEQLDLLDPGLTDAADLKERMTESLSIHIACGIGRVRGRV